MKYYSKIELANIDIITTKCLAYITPENYITATNEKILKLKNQPLRPGNGSFWALNNEGLLKHCPELVVAFAQYNLKCLFSAVYVMYHPTHTSLHADASKSRARINLPLLNCKNTYTEFYSDIEIKTQLNIDTGVNVLVPKDPTQQAVLVDKIELSSPTVLRIDVMHRVEIPFNNPVPRITLLLEFDRDPIYMLED